MYQPSDDPRLQDVAPLGRGGTAEVASAFHRHLKRLVAVKYPLDDPGDSSVDFAALIRREFELIGDLRFPGLVRALEDPSPHFDHFYLELCRGRTLDQLERIEDITLTLNIISALALDLEFLNAAGLVHGDLKPHNVFLPAGLDWLASGRPAYVKLSDFSMGRRRDEHDRYRFGLGTVGYMAPETVTDSVADHRSDLFALGIIAYQLLTGRHPFMDKNSDPVEVNSRIRETSPPPVRELRPELPDIVNDLVVSLLAREASDRPAAAYEVCRVLEKAGASYPYARALRPAHLLKLEDTYQNNLRRAVELDDRLRTRLDVLCENSTPGLRLVLEYNSLRDNIEYGEGRFRFKRPAFWPNGLRNRCLTRFSGWGYAARKNAVIEAVRASTRPAGERSDTEVPSPALSELLLPLLRPVTVKRITAKLAPEADRRGDLRAAAELYVMAGLLSEAERCAHDAAQELRGKVEHASALSLLSKVIGFAELTGRRWDVRQLLMLRGDIHKENGEIERAGATYQNLIDLYAQGPHDKLLATAHKALGDIHRMRQDTDASLKSLERSLEVFTELGDELEISHTRTNIGNVYWLRGDYSGAIRSYRAALMIQKKLGVMADYASTLHNIATMYCSNGRTKRGLFLFKQSLRLKKEIGNLAEIARTLNNLGYVYQISGQPFKAAEHLAESLEINRRIGSNKELAYNLENLAELMISAGQLREAMSVLREGIDLSVKHSYNRHLAALRIHTATVQKRMGQYGEAGESLAMARSVLDGIDDKLLEVAWQVQEAGLCYHLGKRDKALDIARSAYEHAKNDNEMVGMLNSLLLVTRLSDDQNDYDEAIRLIEKQHLQRERLILDFGCLEYAVENELTERSSHLAEQLLSCEFTQNQDLELPWMLNLCAEMLIARDEGLKADAFLQRASQLSSASGLIPELTVTLSLLGQRKYAEGDYEGCFVAYKKALQMCKEISEGIRDKEYRAYYQKKRIVKFLAGEIKRLSQRLGEKQRAG